MGQRLLLVDNDRSFLKEHQVSLEAAFDLEVASSPESVLARLESGDFAAVFISVEVAENKGYALCSAIRKNPKLDAVKVALISAKATHEEYRRHQSLKGHADLYLHKPITPSALVTELRPLVPGLALDPDNPLGELVDSELGDDWLDGLKSVLDSPVPAQASTAGLGTRPPSPVQTQNLDAKATTLAGAARQELLEAQVAALQEELHARDQRLREAEAAAQQSQRQLNSVTLNLDELESSHRAAEALKAALAAKEASFAAVQRELERSQREAVVLKAALTTKEEARVSIAQELEESRRVQDQLNATLEGLVAKHAGLEGIHQSALLEVAGHKEKAHTYQLELAGVEATMRGQGRDLAELGERLQQHEAELAARQARVLERDQQLLARQEVVRQHLEEITRLAGQLAALRQEQDEARVLHEGQQLELMHGLDEKEAELIRLNQLVADQLEAYAAIEREKQTLHGQLAEHRDRLQNLDGLLQEIQDKLRRGSDLARG